MNWVVKILPSRYKVHKIYGITENRKMGRKNFFRGFTFTIKIQGNMSVKSLIKFEYELGRKNFSFGFYLHGTKSKN